jgi:hypothetical protein
MDLDIFRTKRREMFERELAEAELEHARLTKRVAYLQEAVTQLRASLGLLEEFTLYEEGKHPMFSQESPPSPAQEVAPCPTPNGAVPTSLVSS